MYAWEKPFLKKIYADRLKEHKHVGDMNNVYALMLTVATNSTMLTGALIFICDALFLNNRITAAKVFSTYFALVVFNFYGGVLFGFALSFATQIAVTDEKISSILRCPDISSEGSSKVPIDPSSSIGIQFKNFDGY